jgi:hypothetical protein
MGATSLPESLEVVGSVNVSDSGANLREVPEDADAPEVLGDLPGPSTGAAEDLEIAFTSSSGDALATDASSAAAKEESALEDTAIAGDEKFASPDPGGTGDSSSTTTEEVQEEDEEEQEEAQAAQAGSGCRQS